MSAAFFCSETGVRIVAPGVCKAVDPKNGQDEFSEPAPADPQTETKPARAGANTPARAPRGD